MALRHPSLAKAVARNIRARAASRGMAIDTLADLAGMSRSYLYAVLAARNAITVDKLASVADALGVDVVALLRK